MSKDSLSTRSSTHGSGGAVSTAHAPAAPSTPHGSHSHAAHSSHGSLTPANTVAGGHSGAATLAAKVNAAKLPERPVRILVADDEHLVATDLALSLASLGYTVVGPVTDGEAALNLAKIAMPDMAVLDIQMPKRDGLSAAAEVFGELGVPVVILSAYSDVEQVEEAKKVGVFGYMVKPVRGEQLRVTLEVAWGRFKQFAQTSTEAESLRQRLEDRRVIERAKWHLVSTKGMGEPDAMKALQKRARDTRQTLVGLAAAILRGDTEL